jgi:hypothetical protein
MEQGVFRASLLAASVDGDEEFGDKNSEQGAHQPPAEDMMQIGIIQSEKGAMEQRSQPRYPTHATVLGSSTVSTTYTASGASSDAVLVTHAPPFGYDGGAGHSASAPPSSWTVMAWFFFVAASSASVCTDT